MIEAFRIVEDQRRSYSYEVTTSAEEAAYLDAALEVTKPPPLYEKWHRLIATPFRYKLPVPPPVQARFRPPYAKRNVLYASRETITSLYEHAFYFLRQRIDKPGIVAETGQRTIFSLYVNDEDVTDISGRKGISRIMDRSDYEPSHAFILGRSEIKIVGYPSCRDPEKRMNYAALEIESLGKEIGEEKAIEFYFDPSRKSIRWLGFNLEIDWAVVG